MKKNKKIYILYKVIEENNTKDIIYQNDFLNYEDIRKYLNICNRDIKKITYNYTYTFDFIDDILKDIKPNKNKYIIIKEDY